MKHLKYILIIILLIGLFSPILRVSARALTATEQQQIATEQAILTSTQAEYDTLKTPGGTGSTPASRQRWKDLEQQRTAASNTINYIQKMASIGVDPTIVQYQQNNDPVGYCTGGNTTETLRITESVCKTWHGHWSAQAPITLTPATSTTQVAPAGNNKNYQLLTQLPCPPGSTNCDPSGKLINVNTETGLGSYLNLMIKIFIGLCAVLSVVMIVIGGLEYMTSELSHSKEAGKEKIRDAILGLLIALGAYALLFTINPDLLKMPGEGATSTTLPDCNYVFSSMGINNGIPDITYRKTNEPCNEVKKTGGDWYFEQRDFSQNNQYNGGAFSSSSQQIIGPYHNETACFDGEKYYHDNYGPMTLIRTCFESTTIPTVSNPVQ